MVPSMVTTLLAVNVTNQTNKYTFLKSGNIYGLLIQINTITVKYANAVFSGEKQRERELGRELTLMRGSSVQIHSDNHNDYPSVQSKGASINTTDTLNCKTPCL